MCEELMHRFNLLCKTIKQFAETAKHQYTSMVAYNLYQNRLISYARWQDFRIHSQKESE